MTPPIHIEYKLNSANPSDISTHLKVCDNQFVPVLSSRINIHEYSSKLFDKAVTFEAWYQNELVGLIAVYFSNVESGEAFISNVSVVDRFNGQGIAKRMLENCILYAQQNNFNSLILEVNKLNLVAINFYQRNLFSEFEANFDSLFLKRLIKFETN
jgi:ribosomal protein S18 acetylase RimI-like enzyme